MAKNKNFIHTIMTSKIWLGIFSVIVILLLYNSVSLFLKREKVWKKVGALEREKKTLTQQKEYINDKNRSINEGIGRETILREKFNVVKPGEKVIVLTAEKEVGSTDKKPTRFWDRVVSFFKIDK